MGKKRHSKNIDDYKPGDKFKRTYKWASNDTFVYLKKEEDSYYFGVLATPFKTLREVRMSKMGINTLLSGKRFTPK